MANKIFFDLSEIPGISGDLVARLNMLVSDKVGIINAIMDRRDLSRYGLFMYQSLTTHARKLWGLKREVSSGGLGVALGREQALLACIGESVERYAMSFAPSKEIIWKEWKNLPASHRAMAYDLHTKEQYQLHGESIQDPKVGVMPWVRLESWRNQNGYLYWPAAMVYLPFDGPAPAESTSTGVATGESLEQAFCSGLCEVIERDALSIHYLRRVVPSQIDTNSLSGEVGEWVKKVTKGYRVFIYKLITDTGAPVFLTYLARGKGQKTHFGIGAGMDLDSDHAILKSIKEALFTYSYCKHLLDMREESPNKIRALYEHFLYYQGAYFDRLVVRNSPRVRYERVVLTLDDLVRNLVAGGYGAYYKILTTPDIARAGLVVMRVVVPGFVDLNKSHVLPRVGARRLWDVPEKMGFVAGRSISLDPHPFP